ncbi:MAG TPA: response regulator [Anaerolineales bacterium]|nr:response regulator [Anaerolineales bacterium]
MPKILVIEDMPESAEMTAQTLRKYGHQVWVAESGDAGLALAAEHSPDLVICDYWLPDLDARTLLSQLRQIQALKDIKVLVCSAAPKDVVDKVQGEPHFDGFISKPYRLSGLLQAIDEQLALAS